MASNSNNQIKRYLKRILAAYKIVHASEIEERKLEILKPDIRRKIYDLCDEPRSAKEIARRLGTKAQNVHYHLNVLADYGLLDFDVEANERVFYQVL